MLTITLLTTIGVISGILGGILGLGGGVFLVPALVILFHLPMRIAVGTSLVGVIATSTGVAAATSPDITPNTSLALRLEIATTLGAIGGSVLAGILSSNLLSVIFGLMVIGTGAYTMVKPEHPGAQEGAITGKYEVHNWPLGLGMGTIAGSLAGMLGVGGGFIKVPVMYTIMGVPIRVATVTSHFMVGITAAASVFVYYARGDIHPLVTAPAALGMFIGAGIGVFTARRMYVSWIKTALVIFLFLIGVQMLTKGVGINVL